ncbi:MAG: protein-export chaperone SecB [Pseudomonadota bacterium]
MAETDTAAPAAPTEQPARPRMQIVAQYIRDMSFENVAVQKGAKVDGTPEVQVQVALDARRLEEGNYEIVIKMKVESKGGDATVFLLELEYGGRFKIDNVSDQQLHPFLLIECPRMLFPYVRRIIGDITRDGGYPPLNVDNIDFLALYQQDLARRQAERATETNGAAPESA